MERGGCEGVDEDEEDDTAAAAGVTGVFVFASVTSAFEPGPAGVTGVDATA